MTFAQWFTRLRAYFDSLHDFCGDRNKLIPNNVMMKYIRDAFGSDMTLEHQTSLMHRFLSEHKVDQARLLKLTLQFKQLFNYGSGEFSSFERNVMDFVIQVQNVTSLSKNVILELETGKDVKDPVLNTIVPNKVVYDTSDLSYEYICNVMEKNIVTTTATYWDADGKQSHVPIACNNDRKDIVAKLSHDDGELSTLSGIEAGKNHINVMIKSKPNVKRSIDFAHIANDLQNSLNVATYTHIISSKHMRNTFRNLLDIAETASTKEIAGKVTDVKRSGDWLQLKSMIAIAKERASPDSYILATRDIPLAAHAICERATSLVTNHRNNVINIRVVGAASMTPELRASKIQELQFFEQILANNWVQQLRDKHVATKIELVRECLFNTIVHMTQQWDSPGFVKTNASSVSPVAVYRQKLLHIMCFVIYLYLIVTYLTRQYASVMSMMRSQRKGLQLFLYDIGTKSDIDILDKLMSVKEFLVSDEGLTFSAPSMISILDLDTFGNDLYTMINGILAITDDFRKPIPQLQSHNPQYFCTNTVRAIQESMAPLLPLMSGSNRLHSAHFLLHRKVSQEGGVVTRSATSVKKEPMKKSAAHGKKKESAASKIVKEASVAKVLENNYAMLMQNISYDRTQIHHYIKLMFVLNLPGVDIGSFKSKIQHWNLTTVLPKYTDDIMGYKHTPEQLIVKLHRLQSGGAAHKMAIEDAIAMATFIMDMYYNKSIIHSTHYISQLLFKTLVIDPVYWCNADAPFDQHKLPFFTYTPPPATRRWQNPYDHMTIDSFGNVEASIDLLEAESPFMQEYLQNINDASDRYTIKFSIGDYMIGLLIRDVYLSIASNNAIPYNDHDDSPDNGTSRPDAHARSIQNIRIVQPTRPTSVNIEPTSSQLVSRSKRTKATKTNIADASTRVVREGNARQVAQTRL